MSIRVVTDVSNQIPAMTPPLHFLSKCGCSRWNYIQFASYLQYLLSNWISSSSSLGNENTLLSALVVEVKFRRIKKLLMLLLELSSGLSPFDVELANIAIWRKRCCEFALLSKLSSYLHCKPYIPIFNLPYFQFFYSLLYSVANVTSWEIKSDSSRERLLSAMPHQHDERHRHLTRSKLRVENNSVNCDAYIMSKYYIRTAWSYFFDHSISVYWIRRYVWSESCSSVNMYDDFDPVPAAWSHMSLVIGSFKMMKYQCHEK